MSTQALSEDLRVARRVLEGFRGFKIIQDWQWNDEVKRWYLNCRLKCDVPEGSLISSSTNWYILASSSYPLGYLKFHPAKEGGIMATFQHQSHNSFGDMNVPWTDGDICLDTTTKILGRTGIGEKEPLTATTRLKWHVERAIQWIEHAAINQLVTDGEPYEIPPLPKILPKQTQVVFSENESSYQRWKECDKNIGYFNYCRLNQEPEIFVVNEFYYSHRDGTHVTWGKVIKSFERINTRGIWIKLSSAPILPPWHTPITWYDLRCVLMSQGMNLDDLIREKIHILRDYDRILLLIGWPIPKIINGELVQMQWFALFMPKLAGSNNPADGFRNNALGCWMRDRKEALADDQLLRWTITENWSPDEISSRGKLSNGLCSKKILLIGAGALGSVVGELLVRAGVSQMLIVDGDLLTAGNLTRHVLTLKEMGENKAVALAERFNKISPHAKVEGAVGEFPPELHSEVDEKIQEADVILDCTGSDELLLHLRNYNWSNAKHFFSLSFGFYLKRLFIFSVKNSTFPFDTFERLIAPWLQKESEENERMELPREGIGCWHPIFPGRIDGIYTMAGIAVKEIESCIENSQSNEKLIVYEQITSENGVQIKRSFL